jgi:hypothetical protein
MARLFLLALPLSPDVRIVMLDLTAEPEPGAR